MFKGKAFLWATFLFPIFGTVAAASAESGYTATSVSALPDAPTSVAGNGPKKSASIPERFLNEVEPGYAGVAGKWDVTINRGEKVHPLTAADKIHYAWIEERDPPSLITASLAAGYEQLRDANPHYGTDSAAFGERFGAAAFRQGVNRMFGDGILPALTHEDPRYYRVVEGGFRYRALHSAEQTVLRYRDDGSLGINYSGLAGHAMADGLPITFYPHNSATASVAFESFGTSLAADAGLKLVREFLPDLFQSVGLLPKRSQ